MIASPALAAGVASQPPAQSSTQQDTVSTGSTWSQSNTVVTASTNRTNATESYDDIQEGTVITQTQTHSLEQNITIPEIEANSTVALLRNARTMIAGLNTSDDFTEAVKHDAIDALNSSIDEYRAGFFADSTDALYYQEQTLSSLNELLVLGANETALDAAATEIETASNVSAALAHYQAQQTVRAHEDELGGFLYTQAEVALDNAAAERDWGDSSGSSTSAIWHYRLAWEHSQIALDTVEEAVDPGLSLEHGPAIETNGTYETPVYISLSDIRPHRYENATLSFENGETRTVSLTGGTMADTSARATVDIPLGEDLANRTVTVSATSQRQPFLGVCVTLGNCERTVEETLEMSIDESNVIPDRPAPDEEVEVEVEDDESGAIVDVEGPGLIEDDISIEDQTSENDTAFRASPVVRVENSTEITEATVRLPVEGSPASVNENLSMYTWDPTRANGSGWTQVGGEYNPETGMLSADVEHFSFFAVFDSQEWNSMLTETITLEDRHVVGSLNDSDGSGTARADFMFSIDVSTSMEPDKLPFAKEAARKFANATYENERIGLTQFATVSCVEVPLTQDTQAVREGLSRISSEYIREQCGHVSIDATNLTAGIERGREALIQGNAMDHEPVMILVGDAKHLAEDPVAAAQRAAEDGITINTVGVTSNINEAVLQEIANATGGGYYFAEEPRDLPDAFERVEEDRVKLVDSDSDGLPDAVEEANPPIPQVVSEADLGTGEERRINTDPRVPDTDGDGLLDGESVTVETRVDSEGESTLLQTRVRWVGDHPARADTDGDGLDDGKERSGWQPIQYTAARNDSIEYLEALQSSDDPDLGAIKDEYFETEEVSSNPFVADTDGDGLSDGTENDLGTNPMAGDTTGDGIPDQVAVEEGLQPTLFDMRPPEIAVTYWAWNKPPLQAKVDYTVHAMFEDPGGLGQAQVLKDGQLEREHPLESDWDDIESEFSSGFWEGIAGSLKGAEVSVSASDRYGNTARTVAIERGNLPAMAADELADRGLAGDVIARYLALQSGFLAGAGESVAGIRAFLNDPVEYVQAMTRILEVIDNIDKIPGQIDEQQEQNNPYDADDQSTRYESYRVNWFKGYISFAAVQMLSPGAQVTRAVKSSQRLSDLVSSLSDSRLRRAVSAARRASYAKNRVVENTKFRVRDTLIRTKDLTKAGARRLIDGARTAGAAIRRGVVSEELDTQTLHKLSKGTDEIDESYRQAVFRGGDGAVRTRDINRGVRRIDNLEGVNAQRAKQLVIETDGQALRLLSELDDSAVRQLTDIEGPDASTFRQSLVRQHAEGAVDAADIQQTIQKVENLDGDAQVQAMQFISESPDGSSVQLLTDFDQEIVSDFFSIGCAVAGSSEAAVKTMAGDDCIDGDRFRRALKTSVANNGNVWSIDAAEVVDTIKALDDSQKKQRAALLVRRTSGEGGAEFLADASSSTIDDVLGMTLDTSGTALPDNLAGQVRVGLVQEYSRGHLSPNNWVGQIYPNAGDATEVVGEIARGLDDLEDAQNVEGAVRIAGKSGDAGSGSYLVDLPSSGASQTPVKGATLEIRVGSFLSEAGNEIRLSWKPDVDFSEVGNEELRDISEKMYDVRDESLVDSAIRSNQKEFDAVEYRDDGVAIYHESKNRKIPDSEDPDDYAAQLAQDLEGQAARYFTARRANGADLNNDRMVVYLRTERLANELRDELDYEWIEVQTSPDVSS